MPIWTIASNGLNESAGPLTKRILKNALDEKGKKYGSFNPTSVNSFCPVAGGGRNSSQVGDFDPATGGGFSSGHRGLR